jgi:chromosome segregation ATPase
MKTGWPKWFGAGARRLELIEGKIQALRSELAAQSERVSMESERFQHLMPALNAQHERLSEVERRTLAGEGRILAVENGIQSILENFQAVEKDLQSVVKESTLGNDEIIKLRTMVLRLELQLNANADEARRIATGLLERIERARLGVNYGRSASAADKIS